MAEGCRPPQNAAWSRAFAAWPPFHSPPRGAPLSWVRTQVPGCEDRRRSASFVAGRNPDAAPARRSPRQGLQNSPAAIHSRFVTADKPQTGRQNRFGIAPPGDPVADHVSASQLTPPPPTSRTEWFVSLCSPSSRISADTAPPPIEPFFINTSYE